MLTLCYTQSPSWLTYLENQLDEAEVRASYIDCYNALSKCLDTQDGCHNQNEICVYTKQSDGKSCDQRPAMPVECQDNPEDESCKEFVRCEECYTTFKACSAACYDQLNVCIENTRIARIIKACKAHMFENNAMQFSIDTSKETIKPNDIWGLALICGNKVHDTFRLSDIHKNGGNRYCPNTNDLASIKPTGTAILDKYYTYVSYSTSSTSLEHFFTWDSSSVGSIGEAECGFISVW